MENCQACLQSKIEIIAPGDNPAFPFKLCRACHTRLLAKALRPLEYFNLTTKHGLTYYLHDDFYDEDGTACQADHDIKDVHLFPFPTPNKNDLEDIINHAMVQWFMDEKTIEEIKKFEPKTILKSLSRRINENRNLSYKIYDLVAICLENFAEDWIREEWKNRNPDISDDFAFALARCLPTEEGFRYFSDYLETIDSPIILSDKLKGLNHFQSELGLTWIEKNIERVQNISDLMGISCNSLSV